MGLENRTSLQEFVQIHSAEEAAELTSIEVDHTYPFAREFSGRDGDALNSANELPFADPEAARMALRKSQLERLMWARVCNAVGSGQWQCRARPEAGLDWRDFPAKLLSRAVPDFSADSFRLLGEDYEDVEFVSVRPISPDERALGVIQRFCGSHDPRAHIVDDVRRAIKDEESLQLTDGRVRTLMNRLELDELWFAKGRRTARCSVCNSN